MLKIFYIFDFNLDSLKNNHIFLIFLKEIFQYAYITCRVLLFLVLLFLELVY